MRLHTLTVTAFGPFAGTETVDFDALSASGLFLLSGPTGAGKTSLLDAVCFALFGQVPGARQHARSLHSDHAPAGRRPEVTLDLTLRGRRLRVTRSPQWERPKHRGAGTTSEPAKVLVRETTAAGWHTRATRLDEAGQLLTDLLGLSMGQFCQVVLLPQGQFAEFLRADADRRRDLLESLFDTGRFTAVERWLVTRRQEAFRALEQADQRLREVLARVAQAAGADLPDVDPGDAPAWLAGLLDEARADALAAGAAQAAAAEGHDAAARELERATALDAERSRFSTLRSRLAELSAAAPAHEAAAAAVLAARSVAPVAPLVADVARLQAELAQAQAAASAAQQSLAVVLPATGTDGGGGPGPSLPDPPALVALARDRRADVGGLKALQSQEQEADRLAAAIDELERQVVALTERSDRVTARLAGAPARREVLGSARDESAEALGALPAAREAAAAAKARLEAAARRDGLARARTSAADRLRTLTDAAQAARGEWLSLRQARLDGMAGELAAGLADGADCPVCGSREHPRPAVPPDGATTAEQEDAAARRLEAADQARASAADELAAAETAHASARVEASGDAPVPELRAARDASTAELERLHDLAARAPADAAAFDAFAEQFEGWVREQVSLDEEARSLRSRVAADRSRLRDLLAVVTTARGDDPSISVRAERLSRLADGLESLAAQVGTVQRLEDQLDGARRRALLAAEERGLASLDDVERLALDDSELTRLDEAHRDHVAETQAVRSQLSEPGLVEAARSPAPDLAAARAVAASRQAEQTSAAAAAAAAAGRVEALVDLGSALADVMGRRAPLAAAWSVADHLSRLAEGKSSDNRLRMSLSAYVLAARLEQVAAAATERLLRMSGDRYSLVHSAAGPRGRGGLHLRVVDAWTGAERDPATLSGGEAFSASLALALGLADVVAAEAGGSVLETLFVDEGFGSLDEETLDEVMGVLDGLRSGGRTVGIVSHVPDLRQRVPARLTVVKGRDGSTVRQ